jgi:hypothetical protein
MPIIILVPFALIACHPLGPKLETDPQCQQNRNDIEGHIAHPKQPPAITVAGEWGNAGGGATWVFHQTGARVRIEVGDLYTDELGRQQYTVDTVMNGTVDGATLYYFDRGPAGVSYGTLSLTGNVLAGPRWGECFLNREFQLARLR